MADIHIEDHSREAIEAKNAAILRFLTAAGLHLEGEAKEELEVDPRRVDTGLLRNSITYALAGEKAARDSYRADKPREGGGTVEQGGYSGTTPEEPRGRWALYLGTNVEYAPYVHEGTARMAPNRFLRNAVERNADLIRKKLEEALKNT